jgi:hypothetical protein
MRRFASIPLLLLIVQIGCTPMIRVDADTYLHNQELYEGKGTIITAELGEVFENHELFQGKRVEITAPIIHFEERDAPSWFIVLEEDGQKIRGYESDFLGWVPPDAVYLARWAKKEGGDVIAQGKLIGESLELDQLTYKTLIVNTSAIPS